MFRKLLRKWAENDHRLAYRAGFEWVCSSVLLDKLPLGDVEIQVLGKNDAFDQGAQDALDVMQQMGVVDRDGDILFYTKPNEGLLL